MGFFKRLFRRTARSSAPAQALAMVLLPEGATFDPSAAIRRFADRFPSARLENIESQDQATTASFQGGTVGFVHVPIPVPAGDLEGPAALAWHWPGAATVIANHRTHVICFVSSPALSAVDLHLLHTQLIASIVEVTGALAVYVGDALLVRQGVDYVDEANEAGPENLPVLLWVGFNGVREETGHAAYTTGLARFGLLELETTVTTVPITTLLDRLGSIAAYELSTDTQIGDAHTVGSSAEERFRVQHGASTYMPDTLVARVSFDTAVA